MSKKYNFDEYVNRKNTASFKWDGNMEYFGKEDIIPMWVADMDFKCAEPIQEAVRERAHHPIYGYSIRTDNYLNAVLHWLRRKHNFEVEKEWITFTPPGVIYAVYTMIQILTEKNNSVIIQSPNYDPLFDIVKKTGRKLVINRLQYKNNKYTLDFEDLEEKISQGAKAIILSNPNNPTGRVWKKWELEKLGNLCLKNNVFVIVDEIYSDFIFKGNSHIPFASINENFAENSMLCYSTNKGFNLGGLQMSTIIIPSEKLRNKFNEVMRVTQTRLDNIFGAVALEAAYTKCDDWLEQVIDYVHSNKKYIIDYFNEKIPRLKVVDSEGTFLLWIDCTALNMCCEDLERFFIDKAGIAFSQGYEFGQEGKGFVRMNIACPISTIKKALMQLEKAIHELEK
ncbi:pyridoxal phosphate-dependent aminotransferase [Clostridiaceae bacterium 35-E11]